MLLPIQIRGGHTDTGESTSPSFQAFRNPLVPSLAAEFSMHELFDKWAKDLQVQPEINKGITLNDTEGYIYVFKTKQTDFYTKIHLKNTSSILSC